jgi:hypothetical protein
VSIAARSRSAARHAERGHQPGKVAEAVSGTLLLNVADITALWAAGRANGTIALATVAVFYLAGNAIGSLAPTPEDSAPCKSPSLPASPQHVGPASAPYSASA